MRAVMSRLIGAGIRAGLVVALIATPALVLPGAGGGDNDVIVLISVAAAVLTFSEYASVYPGLVEFRDAPPFNRIRFLTLFFILLLVSLAVRDHIQSSAASRMVLAVGDRVGAIIDFPFSPVRLGTIMVPAGMAPGTIALVRSGAGLAGLISLIMLVIFEVAIRIAAWPNRFATFNVWINLPTFAPAAGRDVTLRLNRDANVNILLGFALPFLFPILAGAASRLFDPVMLSSAGAMVWTVTLWAFLPASLFMRGIALRRVAALISDQFKAAKEAPSGRLLLA